MLWLQANGRKALARYQAPEAPFLSQLFALRIKDSFKSVSRAMFFCLVQFRLLVDLCSDWGEALMSFLFAYRTFLTIFFYY